MDPITLYAAVGFLVLILVGLSGVLRKKRSAPGVAVRREPVPVPESFLSRSNGSTEYDRVELVSVHGDFLKVRGRQVVDFGAAGRREVCFYSTVTIHDIHPEDRGRVARLARIHPTSGDQYEFIPDR